MIGAHTDEIALIPNTTTGIHLVAEGFPWQAGDNLVTLSNEFPSNLYPWMNLQSRGVETAEWSLNMRQSISIKSWKSAMSALESYRSVG